MLQHEKFDSQKQITDTLDSQFRKTIDSYLGNLTDSMVHNLEELMQFMRDNADKEMPPGTI